MESEERGTTRRRLFTAMGVGGVAAVTWPRPAEAGHDGTNVFHLDEGNVSPFNFTTELTSDADGTATMRIRNLGALFALHTQAYGGGTSIVAESQNGTGIVGVSEGSLDDAEFGGGSGTGVLGKSGSGPGVDGVSDSGDGVIGHSTSGKGGAFSSVSGHALFAGSQTGPGGEFRSTDGTGLISNSTNGTGAEFGSQNGAALVANGQAFVQANVDQFALAAGNDHAGGGAGGVYGRSSGGSPGIRGDAAGSGFGIGALGVCNENDGAPGVGVQGVSGYGPGQVGTGSGVGVEGLSNYIGVRGRSDAGTAGDFETVSGRALRVGGPAGFTTAGAGRVPVGANQAVVANTAVTPNSHITVTFVGDPAGRVVSWIERQGGSGFTVRCSGGTGKKANLPAVDFTYLIVEPA